MATRADGTILVRIIGDAKGLGRELDTADRKLGGFGKKLGGALAIGIATDQVLDFAQTALGESDRIGDALTRLQTQIGDDLTGALDKASDKFTDLGLSRQDVLELEAGFADVATAIGLADDKIADFAGPAAEAAGAIALLTDNSPDEVIALIGKAAGGSEKALRALGINLSDAEVEARALRDTGKDMPDQLTDTEKAAAAYALVLEKLAPRVSAVTDASGDLEQKQGELQAKFETLTGKIGEGLEGPLTGLLDWILAGIEGWELLAERVGPFIDALGDLGDEVRDVLGPLGGLADVLGNILGLLGDVSRFDMGSVQRRVQGAINGGGGGSGPGPGPNDRSLDRPPGTGPQQVTINVPPSGVSMEAAVVRAIRDYEARNGKSIGGT